jgi:predicted signal transduction protein with EAL and GGDEF domain
MPKKPLNYAERRSQIDGTILPDGRLKLAGRSLTARQWGFDLGVSVALIAARLAFGETVRVALTAPIATCLTPRQAELADRCEALEDALLHGGVRP